MTQMPSGPGISNNKNKTKKVAEAQFNSQYAYMLKQNRDKNKLFVQGKTSQDREEC